MLNRACITHTTWKGAGLEAVPQECSVLPSVDFLRGASNGDPRHGSIASQYPCASRGMRDGEVMYTRLLAMRNSKSVSDRGAHV